MVASTAVATKKRLCTGIDAELSARVYELQCPLVSVGGAADDSPARTIRASPGVFREEVKERSSLQRQPDAREQRLPDCVHQPAVRQRFVLLRDHDVHSFDEQGGCRGGNTSGKGRLD